MHGRYPPGMDSAGDSINQGSLGDPYKTNTGNPVDPKDVTWP